MRILFWGTPEFSTPALRALLDEGHDVVGVVTRPDRPAGRGRKLRPPPVKELAEIEDLPVLQPERPRGDAFLGELRDLEPELSVVVAYGRILRRAVLDLPELGSVNVHASLLPELRGAAPVNWAIIRGHEQTGVTIMRMVEELDAGPILYQVEEPIHADERATDLTMRLSELGAESVVEALMLLEAGAVEPVEQDDSRATYAPRLSRDDARIDWGQDAVSVGRWIRGLDEFPGGWTTLNDEPLKVYRPQPEPDARPEAEPGTVLEVDPARAAKGLRVACGEGVIRIREVKPAGKRRMTSAEWVRGRGAAAGDRLV